MQINKLSDNKVTKKKNVEIMSINIVRLVDNIIIVTGLIAYKRVNKYTSKQRVIISLAQWTVNITNEE